MAEHVNSPFPPLPEDLPIRLTIITGDGVSQYTQGDQTYFDQGYPKRDIKWTTYTSGTWPWPDPDEDLD